MIQLQSRHSFALPVNLHASLLLAGLLVEPSALVLEENYCCVSTPALVEDSLLEFVVPYHKGEEIRHGCLPQQSFFYIDTKLESHQGQIASSALQIEKLVSAFQTQ
jgi:hypothetical protein